MCPEEEDRKERHCLGGRKGVKRSRKAVPLRKQQSREVGLAGRGAANRRDIRGAGSVEGTGSGSAAAAAGSAVNAESLHTQRHQSLA